MKKLRAVLLFLLGFALIGAAVFFLLGYFRPKGAGLKVNSAPAASIFVNGSQVGTSPYEYEGTPGEITVKLVPGAGSSLTPFETKVALVAGIQTSITWEFGDSEEASQGEIISFEKIGGKEAQIAIVSEPNSAQISIDGNIRGFAPVKYTLAPGEHEIKVVAPSYKERIFSVKTVEGYKLTAVSKLAPSGVTPEEKLPSQVQTLIEIIATPTGFLRVRDKPGTAGAEIGQAEPGDRFVFLEEDQATGWYKIEFSKNQDGWVSNQYAKKVEGELTPGPTPSASARPTASPKGM